MDLPNSLLVLSRNPELCAWRPTGPFIHITTGLQVFKVFVHKPYRWIPCLADLIATDWMTGTQEQAVKFLQQQTQGAEA